MIQDNEIQKLRNTLKAKNLHIQKLEKHALQNKGYVLQQCQQIKKLEEELQIQRGQNLMNKMMNITLSKTAKFPTKQDLQKKDKNEYALIETLKDLYIRLAKQLRTLCPDIDSRFYMMPPSDIVENPRKLIEIYLLVQMNQSSQLQQMQNSVYEPSKIAELYELFVKEIKENIKYVSSLEKPQHKKQKKNSQNESDSDQDETQKLGIQRIIYKLNDLAWSYSSCLEDCDSRFKYNLYKEFIACIVDIRKNFELMQKSIKMLQQKQVAQEPSSLKQPDEISSMKTKMRELEIWLERQRFQRSVERKMNEAHQFNLKSILFIAHEEVKRLNTKLLEYREKQEKIKELLKQ